VFEGLTGVIITTLFIPAHRAIYYCGITGAEIIITSQVGVSLGLFTLHAYIIAEILEYLRPKYIPVRLRGSRPYKQWVSDTVSSARQISNRVCVYAHSRTITRFRQCQFKEKSTDDHFGRLLKGLSRVNRSASRLWAIIFTFLPLVRSSIGIAVAIQEPLFAIQHMIFCLSANGDGAAQHLYDSDSFLIAIDNCSSKCIV
jgi:hypothetical protein